MLFKFFLLSETRFIVFIRKEDIPVNILGVGRVEKGLFKLDAVVGTNDGSEIIRHSTDGKPEDAQNLAIQLAKLILVQGRN